MTSTTPSLLITDDDQDFRETLQAVFEPRGFRTLLAADGEEAVDIVRSNKVHLVLCDMHMPKMTGLEAIRTVHQMFKDLPCILMSADLDEDIVREAKSVQVFSVLPKPVTAPPDYRRRRPGSCGYLRVERYAPKAGAEWQ